MMEYGVWPILWRAYFFLDFTQTYKSSWRPRKIIMKTLVITVVEVASNKFKILRRAQNLQFILPIPRWHGTKTLTHVQK